MSTFAPKSPAALRRLSVMALVGLSLAVSACQTLLPDGQSEIGVTWKSYDEAAQAIERIVPYETRRQDLWASGLDPRENPSITILSYSDMLQRFAAGSVVRREELDRGIRDCLSAGKRCGAYWIQLRRVTRERIGNFWLDSLAFRRETNVSGWSFNALIVLVDDLVVYTLHGGQPEIHEREVVRNPLGPLQSWGDQAPKFIR